MLASSLLTSVRALYFAAMWLHPALQVVADRFQVSPLPLHSIFEIYRGLLPELDVRNTCVPLPYVL